MAKLFPSSPPKLESEPRLEFSSKIKLQALVLCKGKCVGFFNPITGEQHQCETKLNKNNTEFDHEIANALRPDNSLKNCKPRCNICHRKKTSIDQQIISRSRRLAKKEVEGIKPSKFPKRQKQEWGKRPKKEKTPLIDKTNPPRRFICGQPIGE